MEVEHYQMLIGGELVDAAAGAVGESINPGNGKVVGTFAYGAAEDANRAVEAARQAFDAGVWRGMSPVARSTILHNFADMLHGMVLPLATLESLDSGATMRRSILEAFLADSTPRDLAWYAEKKFPWREEVPIVGTLNGGRSYLLREPVGVCAAIIPWNFPMSIALWKIFHAITMGNSVVLKTAEDTPLSALLIARLLKASGIPDGVVNIITGTGPEVGEALVKHPLVNKISFTGSTRTGRRILELAAESIKRVTVELGGKSANIILPDADLDLAIDSSMYGTFWHSGQVCHSGTRIFVHRSIYEAYLERLIRRTEQLIVGYQMDPRTHIGPICHERQLETIEEYVADGKRAGAEVVYGGAVPEGEMYENGFYYMPTIFSNVDNQMRIAQEEIFGPVVVVIPFDEEEEAIAMANDTIYGLGGGVFSRDLQAAERVAAKLEAGTVWINDWHSLGNWAPFGGYKQSGIGRELGYEGLAAYVETKRVHHGEEQKPEEKATFSMLFDYPPATPFLYNCPTKLIAGENSIGKIPHEMARRGLSRALIITDPGIVKAGLVARLEMVLGDYLAGVYDEVVEDSGYDVIAAAAARFREKKADLIISLGGGSSIDTAKCVAVAVKNDVTAEKVISYARLGERQTPHFAVPTTAGTGSEVTNVAVVKNRHHQKSFLLSDYIIPDVAYLDPTLTVGLPGFMTAASGMDALTHAVEAVIANGRNAPSTGQGLHAIRLIMAYLPRAVGDGNDLAARYQMQIAATMAGWAFTAGPGTLLAHSMAHVVGGMYGGNHGALCGICLPHTLRFTRDYALEQMVLVAEAMGIDTRRLTQTEAADAAAAAIEQLMIDIGHPTQLRALGVQREHIPELAYRAASEITTIFNPRPAGVDDLIELFELAY